MIVGNSPEGAARRLDQALTERGLARSRTHASRLVAQGVVRVDGVVVSKPSLKVGADADLSLDVDDRYVSRAALKLLAALDAFDLDARDRGCLDVGTSTGGFSQVLLERGARHVVGLEVGHGQLDPRLATHENFTLLEGFNARDATRDELDRRVLAHAGRATATTGTTRDDSGTPLRASDITLVVADLSFISLTLVIEPLRRTVAADADFVLLIKPQFEVGRRGVRGGIVTDSELVRAAITRVLHTAHDVGLGTLGLMPSPIVGTHGNQEYVAHFAAARSEPTQWTDRIDELTKGARA